MINLLLALVLQDDFERLRSDSIDEREGATEALVKIGDVEKIWPLLFDDDPDVRDRAQRILAAKKVYDRVLGALFDGSPQDRAAAAQIFHRMHAPNLQPQWREQINAVMKEPLPASSFRELMQIFPLILADGVDLDRTLDHREGYLPRLDRLERAAEKAGLRMDLAEGAVVLSREPSDDPICVRVLKRLAATEPWSDLESAACVADLCDNAFIAALEAHVDSKQSFWRHALPVLVCRLAKYPASSPATRRLAFDEMHRGDWNHRALAATALWNRAAESADEWRAAFESRDPAVKFCAAYVMERSSDSEAKSLYSPAFARLFEAEEIETLRETLSAAFVVMPCNAMPYARMLWIDAADDDHVKEFRAIDDSRLARAVVDLLDLGRSRERTYALSIVDAFKDDATVAAVGRLAKGEPLPNVMEAYVSVLDAYLPAEPALQGLEDFFVRAPDRTSERARDLLTEKAAPRAKKFFAGLAHHDVESVRLRVVEALYEYARAHDDEKNDVLATLDAMASDAATAVADLARQRAELLRHPPEVIICHGSGSGRYGTTYG